MEEERDEGGEDAETCRGDRNGVDDKCCIEGGVEGIETVLDFRGPFYI